MTLLLSNEDLDGLVSMRDAIDALDEGYRDLAAGRATSRRRIDSFAEAVHRDELFMLSSSDAIYPRAGVAVVRMSSHVMHWPARDGVRRREKIAPGPGGAKPVGLILLFSTETGEPLAILPDGVLSVLRVGATSALGARYLAPASAPVVAILGSGKQAVGQLEGICAVRRVEVIRTYSPTPETRTAFARASSERLGIPVEPASSPEEALRGANVVICATNSLAPVYLQRWISPGIHISSIRPTEIEAEVIRRADLVAVHTREALAEQIIAEGIELPEKHDETKGVAEVDFAQLPQLTDLVSGRIPGRTAPAQVTCFLNTIGIGFQFAVLGELALRRAREAFVGREFPTEWLGQD